MEVIKNLDDLLNIKQFGEYELGCDIDCKNYPIRRLLPKFSGVLNGNFHTIKNLFIKAKIHSDEEKVSLFDTLHRATILNVNFENVKIDVSPICYEPYISLVGCDSFYSEVKNIVAEIKCNLNSVNLIAFSYDSICENNKIKLNGKDIKTMHIHCE